MLKFAPILLALLYGLALYRFSAWRTARHLDAQSTPLTDPRLKPLTDRMARALDLPRVPVHVYEVAQVNGLALEDGRVFVTRGFLDLLDQGKVSADEIASVIAHELGHVALGHARKRMISFSGQNALAMMAGMVLGRFIPFVGPSLAGQLSRLLAAHLSRSDEYEADAWASALLLKSGIGTQPQKTLFAKLEQLTGAAHGARPAWTASHPSPVSRIEAITRNEDRWRVR